MKYHKALELLIDLAERELDRLSPRKHAMIREGREAIELIKKEGPITIERWPELPTLPAKPRVRRKSPGTRVDPLLA